MFYCECVCKVKCLLSTPYFICEFVFFTIHTLLEMKQLHISNTSFPALKYRYVVRYVVGSCVCNCSCDFADFLRLPYFVPYPTIQSAVLTGILDETSDSSFHCTRPILYKHSFFIRCVRIPAERLLK